MKLEKFEEQVFFNTVRITIPSKSGSGASLGTGFIMNVPIGDPAKRRFILLISNRHVFKDPTSSIALNFHKATLDGTKPELGYAVHVEGPQFDHLYVGHPDPDVDLACINISTIVTQPNFRIFYKGINPCMLADFSEENLYPGKSVWFVGYPENRFDTRHNLPILRRGWIASIPTVDFEGKKHFLIDAQVFPGSSGSPVFTIINKQARLIGVVTQTMIRNEQLQIVPTEKTLGVEQILGLGIVIKVTAIKELIEYVTSEEVLRKKESGEPV